MSFDAMLNHECDVYHIRKTGESPGFALPASPMFSYPGAPDIVGLRCHFGVRIGVAATIAQREPFAEYDNRIKLTVPPDTDIRVNDRIVDAGSGLAYTADFPTAIRDHHMIVMLRRTDDQKAI